MKVKWRLAKIMNDKGGTGEQTPSSILVYIRLEITLGATQQAEAAVFREMRPRGRSFVGSAARISRDVCLAAEGRDSLTPHLNSWRARPPSAAVGGALCQKHTKKGTKPDSSDVRVRFFFPRRPRDHRSSTRLENGWNATACKCFAAVLSPLQQN